MTQMRRIIRFIALMVTITLLATGCWDREELNDRAIILSWGVDLLEDDTVLGTANFVLPKGSKSSGGSKAGGEQGGSNAFMTETAIGKNISDSGLNMQKKLSRTIFPGHRRNIFIGEKMALQGIAGVMDQFSRNPQVRPRANIFVVKDGTAQKAMSLAYQLEMNPALAVQKIQEKMGAPIARSLIDFLIAVNGPGCSVMPTVHIVQPVKTVQTENKNDSPPKPTLEIAGSAIFDKDLKLKGYLDSEEYWLRLWITGNLHQKDVTGTLEEAPAENYSLSLAEFKKKIRSDIQGDRILFNVTLQGAGTLNENNTTLDLSKSYNVKKVERAMESILLRRVEEVVAKVQKDYKCDVFELGETLHRQHPQKWKSIESEWTELFPKAEIALSVKIDITNTGNLGKSLLPVKAGGPEE
ncbi:hypothetical protein C2I18_27710 [Paenibacillus sp. PK3_47]|uniref:Ger(x)C family spore germination protein n=1 Tax=Paenibacillus sp. PK3_47 TaxID=2072642 RepID=UPI00201E28CA|nr:Ger(x)C family spore germination protein [Paenibacillus sp. PK3_47]UQZ36986.1 hypothetical protein C2I18_27710 [Paenibacillus sp. PK3_47]